MHLAFIIKHKIARILTITCMLDMLVSTLLGIFLIRNIENGTSSLASILIILFVLASIVATFCVVKWVNEKIRWYEEMLDAIPFPISVTDNNMKWTFVNRPVEDLIKVNRANVHGKACSNWGASICNTEDCGIKCFKKNRNITNFTQAGRDFRVYVNQLFNINNKKIGHIEIVQDITELVGVQNTQRGMIDELRNTSGAIMSASSIVTQKTQENAKTANEAASLTERVKSAAERGFEQMTQMTQSVKEINEASLLIKNVMKTINSIASQTNILALNASVESVRAGEHGKSFSVVAEEVRNLAAMCTKSADETSVLVANCIEKASLGAEIADKTAESLMEIISGIKKSDALMKEIAESSMEQSSGIVSIHDSIERMEHILSTSPT